MFARTLIIVAIISLGSAAADAGVMWRDDIEAEVSLSEVSLITATEDPIQVEQQVSPGNEMIATPAPSGGFMSVAALSCWPYYCDPVLTGVLFLQAAIRIDNPADEGILRPG